MKIWQLGDVSQELLLDTPITDEPQPEFSCAATKIQFVQMFPCYKMSCIIKTWKIFNQIKHICCSIIPYLSRVTKTFFDTEQLIYSYFVNTPFILLLSFKVASSMSVCFFWQPATYWTFLITIVLDVFVANKVSLSLSGQNVLWWTYSNDSILHIKNLADCSILAHYKRVDLLIYGQIQIMW